VLIGSSDPEFVVAFSLPWTWTSSSISFPSDFSATNMAASTLTQYQSKGWPCLLYDEYTYEVPSGVQTAYTYEIDVDSPLVIVLSDYFSYSLDNGDTCNEFGSGGWITYSCTMGDDSAISIAAFTYDSGSGTLTI